ncbi:hypothetical protein Tco_1415180 [Tanacetum coccineum]
MAPLPPRKQRNPFLRYQGLEYTDVDIVDFEERLERIYSREIHKVQVVDFQGMSELMRDGLFAMMAMEHRDDTGVVLRFGEVLLDLDAPDTIQFQLGRARRCLSWRQFILALGLHTREEMESPGFARMMAHSIAGRSQAPKKVTVTDLFYLRGMDVGSVNIPYLLAQYLRRFAAGRKSGAHISRGQFVARLAEHFGLLAAEILAGLTLISPELPIIDMAELVRLQIYEQLDDAWVWVAGPERKPNATGPPGVAQDTLIVDEGGQADPAPVHASPPPLVAARTMPQRWPH